MEISKNFKTELTAFARDLQAMCNTYTTCDEGCPLKHHSLCMRSSFAPDPNSFEAVFAAVEAYRNRKKPCAEVIDRARDVYTIEVEMEIERNSWSANRSVDSCAERLRQGVWQYYCNNNVAVRVLSAERFILESHIEENEE